MSTLLTAIQDINGAISNVVWGPIMLTLLIGTGLLLSARMGFPQFTKFAYVMKNTIGGLFTGKHRTADESGVSPFQDVATAMGWHHRYWQHHRCCHGIGIRRSRRYFLDVGQCVAGHGN